MRDDRLRQVLGDYQGWLYREASAVAGPSEIDDLVQEGYIAMWRALDTYDAERGSLPAWLTLKARDRMRECAARRRWTGMPPRLHGRNKAAEPRTLSLDAPRAGDGATLADLLGGGDPMEAVEIAYHHGEIADALAGLTSAQRRYVRERFWGGKNTRELTEEFGYDPGGLWRSPRNGARGKLAVALAHLEKR